MAAGDQSLSLAEKILGDYSQPDIPELNAVSQFVQLDTCNNSQSHFANLDADFMTLDNQDELQVTDFYSLCDYLWPFSQKFLRSIMLVRENLRFCSFSQKFLREYLRVKSVVTLRQF